MKKIVFILGLFFVCVSSVYAVCDGGTEITGKNGHVYCKSNVNMNWYTAFAWCDAQGRTLATMEQMCDIDETQRWDGNVGTSVCLCLVGATAQDSCSWSALPYSPTHAFSVYVSTANVSSGHRTLVPYYALCW